MATGARGSLLIDLTDEGLLRRCRDGDHAAWSELVLRHQKFVYSVARSNGLDEHDASDVLQITFAELLQQLDRLREPERLRGWLGVVARRQSWRLREARRVGDDPDMLPDLGALDADIERVAMLDSLTSAMEQLGEPCRALIERLFLSDGATDYATVAAELGIPVGSIGPTRQRCLDKLKLLLESQGSGA